MNKGKIVANTLLFIGIIGFIKIFSFVFGDANEIVGVAIITLALALLQKNLMASPIDNLIKLIIINVFTGIASSLASQNIWLGIIINLTSIFLIAYVFSTNIKASIVIPVGFQYLFMLYSPVSGNDFTLRIASLIFGAFFTMGLQIIVNKNKLRKRFIEGIVNLNGDLIKFINGEINDEAIVFKQINTLKKIVYESRRKRFYLSENGKVMTNIIFIIESIYLNLISDNYESKYRNKELVEALNYIKDSMQNHKVGDILSVSSIKRNKLNDENIDIYIDSLVVEINKLKFEDIKKTNVLDMPESYKWINIAKETLNKNALKFSYALKLSITLSIAMFFVDFYNLEEGRWLIYTMFSLIQPYFEDSRMRLRYRIEGTLIGVIIVILAFLVIKDEAMRGLIVLFAGYLNPFAKHYRVLMIIVTVSVLADIGASGGILGFSLSRVFFIIIGAIFAFFACKYISPYKIVDGYKESKELYSKIIKNIKVEVDKNKKNENSIKNLYLLSGFLDEKIYKVSIGRKEEFNFIREIECKRIIINSIYSKYYLDKNDINII